MANTKKFITKNGLLTQNVDFLSPNEANTISLSILDSDTLSVSGDFGQLLSITDSLTSPYITSIDIRAPIFYDSANISYYCDPASTSNFMGLTVINTITGSISGNAATATNVAWSGVTSPPSTYPPSSHTHGNITNAGAIGTTTGLQIETTTGGVLTAKTAGTTSQFLRGDNTWVTPPDTTYTAGNGLGLSAGAFSLDTPGTLTTATTNAVTADSHTHAITTASANTVSTIVSRDASGNFSAGTITAALTGNGIIATKTNTEAFVDSNDTTLSVRGDASYGAVMSFNRAGAYAVNFGLDTDNVMKIGGWSASTIKHSWDMSGNYTAVGNVTAYSDINLKDNIEVITDALDKVNQIRGVTFTRNDQEDKEKRHTGVIAQEVELILPEVISENSDGIKSVAYGNMVGLLIEAIKEQQSTIESLKQLLISQETRLDKIERSFV